MLKLKHFVFTLVLLILVGVSACSSKKHHATQLHKSGTPSGGSTGKDADNYHLKTANKIVDESSSKRASRERKAERKRKKYNQQQEEEAKEKEKAKKKGGKNRYRDKKSSGKVPLY